jgi:ferredoxin
LPSLKDASGADISAGQEFGRKAEEAITRRVEIDRIQGKTVLDLYNSDIWTKVYESCLNCGTCTYTCPTCHCFDIQDEATRDGGVRLRNWDSCMTWLFTAHATGHNPRPSGKERFRQRFMHKFKYIPVKRDGETGCVGCGRCINLCPVNLDVREIVGPMNN